MDFLLGVFMKDYVKIKEREVNLFIYHLSNRIDTNHQPFLIKAQCMPYNQTVNEVFIETYGNPSQTVRLGKLISYFSNCALPEDTYFYFFPDATYFSYCKMDSINLMLKMSTDLLQKFVHASKLQPLEKSINDILVKDFSYDLSLSHKIIVADYFDIKNVAFVNSTQLVFRFTNEGKSGQLKDDFKFMIQNNDFKLQFFRADIFDKLNFVLSKNGDIYELSNPTELSLYHKKFTTYDEFTVALQDIFDTVYYGVIFDVYNLDKPTLDDFKANRKKYLKILEMFTA